MSKIARFEDFIAWQKARQFASEIYKVTSTGNFSKDFGLRDQVRRASVSVMANIAEGFERGRPAEFQHFLSLSKASCAEIRSHLYVALDAGYLLPEVHSHLQETEEELGRIIGGLRVSAQTRRDALVPTHHS